MGGGRKLKLLIVEDVEDDALLLLSELERTGYQVDSRRVETARDMRIALTEPWDLVISDFSLPQFGARAALDVMHGTGRDLPFIIVSGTVGEETAVDAMRAGAHDYLMKGNLKRLAPVIERELREAEARADRRRSTDALSESDQRFRLLMRATSDVVWDWDLSTDEVWLSDAIRRTYFHDVEKMSSEAWLELVHTEDRERVGAGRVQLAQGKTAMWTGEYRLRRGDGTYAEVLDRVYSMTGPSPHLIGSVMDESASRRADDARKRAEQTLRTLIEGSPEPSCVHQKGTVLFINRALESTLGWTAAELVGHSVQQLLAEDALLLDENEDVPRLREYRGRRANGTSADLEILPLPIVYDGQSATLLILHEVTDRKVMAARLMQVDRMVAMGTLAAGVAHEINNPLSVVMVNLEFLDEELQALGKMVNTGPADVTELLEFVETAQEGAERVRRVVRDLKVFSRSEEERIEPVDLHRVIESSLNMAWTEIRHRARLVKQFGVIPLVAGNEARLGQVFLNLLINAAHATPEGRAEANQISISTYVEDGKVIAEIQDSGSGIAPEVLPRIFDAFFTTKPIGVGTGLGLPICQNIVVKLGGEVSVQSELGRGSTFRVVLPASTAEAPVAEWQEAPAVPTRQGRILVIDDDEMVGKSLQRFLAREHQTDVCQSAVDALELAEANTHYDIIFCDLMMPYLSGMEYFQRLMALSPQQASKVVFLTGGAFTPAARQFLDEVPNPKLDKPVRIEVLRTLVAKLLA